MVAGALLVCSPSADTGNAEPPGKLTGDKFASERESGIEPVAFNVKRAMGYLETVCKIGPRQSGTDGMKKQQDLIQKHFENLGAKVTFQRFKARQRSVREMTDMANMVISWNPENKTRVIL